MLFLVLHRGYGGFNQVLICNRCLFGLTGATFPYLPEEKMELKFYTLTMIIVIVIQIGSLMSPAYELLS